MLWPELAGWNNEQRLSRRLIEQKSSLQFLPRTSEACMLISFSALLFTALISHLALTIIMAEDDWIIVGSAGVVMVPCCWGRVSGFRQAQINLSCCIIVVKG